MFKNILVHVPSERPVRPVIEVAVALTMARRWHLDAVAIGYESMGGVGMLVGSGGAAIGDAHERFLRAERGWRPWTAAWLSRTCRPE